LSHTHSRNITEWFFLGNVRAFSASASLGNSYTTWILLKRYFESRQRLHDVAFGALIESRQLHLGVDE